MGLTSNARPFGRSTDAAVDIEGLVVSSKAVLRCSAVTHNCYKLLEDHLKRLREEEGAPNADMEEDDEAAWEGWDVESDSSDNESSDGWIDVESDGEDNLEVSDSEDEGDLKKDKGKGKEKAMDVDKEDDGDEVPALLDPSRISTLATTKVCQQYSPLYYLVLIDEMHRSSRPPTSHC